MSYGTWAPPQRRPWKEAQREMLEPHSTTTPPRRLSRFRGMAEFLHGAGQLVQPRSVHRESPVGASDQHPGFEQDPSVGGDHRPLYVQRPHSIDLAAAGLGGVVADQVQPQLAAEHPGRGGDIARRGESDRQTLRHPSIVPSPRRPQAGPTRHGLHDDGCLVNIVNNEKWYGSEDPRPSGASGMNPDHTRHHLGGQRVTAPAEGSRVGPHDELSGAGLPVLPRRGTSPPVPLAVQADASRAVGVPSVGRRQHVVPRPSPLRGCGGRHPLVVCGTRCRQETGAFVGAAAYPRRSSDSCSGGRQHS